MAEIYPLSEGVFTVGHDKMFVPFDTDNDILHHRPTGSLLVEVQPFLVVTARDVIIFDTGLGFYNTDGELTIHHNIRKHGYEPAMVTKVLMSHLHKDHAGCMVFKDNLGITHSTFPNADYYIYRPEAGFALEKGLPSYNPADIDPILATSQIKWLDGETGSIDNYIEFTHSGGHCPEHIVFLITDGDEKIFYGGDEAPQLKQLKMNYVAKYDYNGKKAMQLRAAYAEKGRNEGWKFLFYHDTKCPVAKL